MDKSKSVLSQLESLKDTHKDLLDQFNYAYGKTGLVEYEAKRDKLVNTLNKIEVAIISVVNLSAALIASEDISEFYKANLYHMDVEFVEKVQSGYLKLVVIKDTDVVVGRITKTKKGKFRIFFKQKSPTSSASSIMVMEEYLTLEDAEKTFERLYKIVCTEIVSGYKHVIKVKKDEWYSPD